MTNLEQFIPNMAEEFGISQQVTFEKSADFFSPIQVAFYRLMNTA